MISETLIRAFSGAVYVAILLFACWFSELSFAILMGIFLVLTTVEFSRLIKFNAFLGSIVAFGYYATFVFFDNSSHQHNIFITFVSVLTAFWLIRKLFQNKTLIMPNNVLKFCVFVGYIVFSFVIITQIPKINSQYVSDRIIGVFVLIWINDTFAYLVGRIWGKHKLLSRVSPKKTIEGFFGGAIFTLLFSIFVINDFVSDKLWKWLVISVLVVVFSTLGDLVESNFKRSAHVKDSGKIMPGHGGILDRLDSIIFVAPFVFLFHQIIAYVS